MAIKLDVYNQALLHLKTRRLRALTDARSERRDLDAVWSPTIDYMLERGMWTFAIRAQQWMSSDTIDPEFGYRFAYEKPDDYVRLADIGADERYGWTLDDYSEEGGIFYCDADPLYVRYVSSGAAYGRDLGKWTPAFTAAVEWELAWRAGGHIGYNSADTKLMIGKERKRALNEAKGSDAVNQPMGQLPAGRLTRARGGNTGYNRMRRTPYQ
jgi:hypothetical protein